MSGAWTTLRLVFTILRLVFTALPLQRVLLLVGSLSAVAGLGAMTTAVHGSASVWVPTLLAGSCILGLSIPPFLCGILLRELSAPRAIQLIPYGRQRLLLGSLLTEVLTASVVALFVVTIQTYDPHAREHLAAIGFPPLVLFTAVFVGVFAAATTTFISLYYGSRYRFGGLVLIAIIAVAQLAARVFPHLSFGDVFSSTTDLLLALAGALGVWGAFGALYLSAGRIAPPVWGRVALTSLGGATVPPPWLAEGTGAAADQGSRHAATCVLLTGSYPGTWRGVARPLIVITAGALGGYALVATGHGHLGHGGLDGLGRMLAVMIAYTGGLLLAIGAFPMIGRARCLWLNSGLDREQLFREAEAQSWRTLGIVTLATGSAAILVCLLAGVPLRIAGEILMLSAVSGALTVYLVLMHTRGWGLADIVLATVLSATWFLELVAIAFGAPGSTLLFPLAAQLALIPVLRIWARARWTRIDWLINRPLQAVKLLGA